MTAPKQRPVVLTIAGSDSGGGAGIQADLKVFAALGVHGTTAITAITAQNPARVLSVEPVSARMVESQLQAVFEAFQPMAIKTGMLHSAPIIQVVVDFLSKLAVRPQLVVDPVMISTSGKDLIDATGRNLLKEALLPMATLITPNLQEAEALAGHEIKDLETMHHTARELAGKHGVNVLIKGGHLTMHTVAPDVLFHDGKTISLEARRIEGIGTHGTGCTLSATIAARLALGDSLQTAVCFGKDFITKAIADSYKASGHWCLNI